MIQESKEVEEERSEISDHEDEVKTQPVEGSSPTTPAKRSAPAPPECPPAPKKPNPLGRARLDVVGPTKEEGKEDTTSSIARAAVMPGYMNDGPKKVHGTKETPVEVD